jgi:hypothetical protein
MVPDVTLLTLVFSVLIMMARFGRIAKALMSQLFAKNLIGSLGNGRKSARQPQALPTSA